MLDVGKSNLIPCLAAIIHIQHRGKNSIYMNCSAKNSMSKRPISRGGNIPALAYALGKIGPAARGAVPVLMRGANDRTKEVRYYSIWALGQIGASDAGTVISTRLSDSESSVREQAKRALQPLAFSERRAE